MMLESSIAGAAGGKAKPVDPTAEAAAYAQAQAAQGIPEEEIMAAVQEQWPDAALPTVKKALIAGKQATPDQGGQYGNTAFMPPKF